MIMHDAVWKEREQKSDKFKEASALATKKTQRADIGAAEPNF